jgi:hypothetical protein
MDETRHTKLATFDATQRLMASLLGQIGEQALEELRARPLAAEQPQPFRQKKGP